GEKKRNEILQMLMLEPKLALLDETDSGLDVDALKIVAAGVNSLRAPDRSVILVTHYERILELIVPDCVHVLAGGRSVKTGDRTLGRALDERGYDWVQAGAQASLRRHSIERSRQRCRAQPRRTRPAGRRSNASAPTASRRRVPRTGGTPI